MDAAAPAAATVEEHHRWTCFSGSFRRRSEIRSKWNLAGVIQPPTCEHRDAEQPEEKPIYGLTTNIDTYNPITVAGGEYKNLWRDIKRCPQWRDKIRYLVLAPGWSHDGPDQRSKTLQAQLAKR